MKRPITTENVFKIEPYRSIVKLLSLFQKHKGGMEQKHFRYALIHNHDIRTPQNKEGLDKWAIAECEGFFGKTIELLIRTNLIKKGCVTSRNNLNGFLNRLLELEVIERDEKSRYRIPENHFIMYEKIKCNDTLNSYDINEETSLVSRENFNHMMFGFADELSELSNSEDIQNLSDSLKLIENTLRMIESLRNKLVLRLYTKRAKKLIANYGNDDFKKFVTHPYMLVDFYQDWFDPDNKKFMELVEYATEKEIDRADVTKTWNDFQLTSLCLYNEESNDENKLRENWGLSQEEFWEVDKLLRKDMENYSLSPMSYVYYPRFGKNLLEKNVDEILQVLEGSG